MAIKAFLIAALAGISSAATLGAKAQKFGCGAPAPTIEQLGLAREFAKIESQQFRENGRIAKAIIPVNVYLHSVSGTQGGLLSDATFQAQFRVLQDNFGPAGVTFTLAGTTRTVNNNWANDRAELTMKRSLRRGDYSDLNIYFQDSLGGNLGYCYFPTTASPGSNAFIRDGCVVLASSVPGGASTGYNLGKTATHEVGHWFGLYHTFQGGCTGAGDEVSDTPAQASPSSGCPTGRDSCPNVAGLDPIHNYMDYSIDSCYEQFSAGQVARINSFWTRYRG